MSARLLLPMTVGAVLTLTATVRAQTENPVYVDDSPAATATFVRLPALMAAGNIDEGVRALQALLDQEGTRVVPSTDDVNLFVGVRATVHARLLAEPDLLARYREIQQPTAERMLADGGPDEVERTRLFTPAGFEAALRVAQDQLENARFEAARLTIEQLADHPDKNTERSRDAASLMLEVARYIDRPDVRQRAADWAREAGVDQIGDGGIVAWPDAAMARGKSSLDPSDGVSLDGILPKPLWTLGLESTHAWAEVAEPRDRDQVPAFGRVLSILPTISGDTLYINDGTTISALNRFTLSPRWQVTPPPMDLSVIPTRQVTPRFGRSYGMPNHIEDPSAVTVGEGVAVATTGRSINGTREGDRRVHAVDTASGRRLWSVAIDTLHPQLEDASVRGPALICEGVVLVGARKYLTQRRLLGVYLVALDLHSGQLLWHHLLGSAGSLPYVRQSMVSRGAILDEGVVYRDDRLGVLGAYEAATGRPIWVRRLPSQPVRTSTNSPPWETGIPIIDGDSLITLAPDKSPVYRIDRTSGAILGARGSVNFGAPNYLLRVGDRLAAVGTDQIGFAPIADFEDARTRLSQPFGELGIRGRVVVAGNKLFVPLTDGVAIVDADKPAASPEFLPLDAPGNLVAEQGQLIVVDDHRVHSYLLWEEAQTRLTREMRQDRSNPRPAVTFADLAYRAGRTERIIEAVDAAISAIKLNPRDTYNQAERRRLFESIRVMVSAGDNQGQESSDPVINDVALLERLVGRMQSISGTNDERVTHLLAAGRLKERRIEPVQAVEIYQQVLDAPGLAGAIWHGDNISVRAELEATRRIEQLISVNGRLVYGVQEAEAGERFAMISERQDDKELRLLARQYPLATVTPAVWGRVAQIEAQRGNENGAVAAFEDGLRAAQRQADPDPDVVGTLAGGLIETLIDGERFGTASKVLRSVQTDFPHLTPMVAGMPLDTERLGEQIRRQLDSIRRWPRIGDLASAEPQVILDWVILPPLMRDRSGEVSPCVCLQSLEEIAIWAPPTPGARLVEIWRRPSISGGARPVRFTADAAYVYFPEDGGRIEKIWLDSAKPAWRTPDFAKLVASLPNDNARAVGANPSVSTPLDGDVRLADMVVAMDDRTLVMADRVGRAAGIDLETGGTLWVAGLPMQRLFDAHLTDGQLAICGDRKEGGAAGAVQPNVALLDGRSGRVLQQHGEGTLGRTRWVRITDAGELVVGYDKGIRAIEPRRARSKWTINAERVRFSRDPWIFGESIFLITNQNDLVRINSETGNFNPEPLDTWHDHLTNARRTDAFAVAPATIAISTYQGLLLYNHDGDLLGADSLSGFDSLLPPEPAHGAMFTVETIASGRRDDGQMVFLLHELNTTTAMLVRSTPIVLGATPDSIMLMDGKIVLSAGVATVVLNTKSE